MEKMTLATLEKLEKNPSYKLSPAQQRQLDEYRSKKFKNNVNFKKHDTNLKAPDGKSS